MLLHASSVAIGSSAVLLTGAPGAGKSDLALRLIDGGATLIADDQTLLRRVGDSLFASAPASIAGMMEIRHLGLMRLPFIGAIPVKLYVDLCDLGETKERLPENKTIFLLDHPVQRLRLPAFAASTPAKIRAALTYETST